MLIENSYRLQRKGIVVVHMQLQVIRLRRKRSGRRHEEQLSTNSLASSLDYSFIREDSNTFGFYPAFTFQLRQLRSRLKGTRGLSIEFSKAS